MPTTTEGFNTRLDEIAATLARQGDRVTDLFDRACRSVLSGDVQMAQAVIDADDEIDRVDVEIEQAAVLLLTDATRDGAALTAGQLRRALTIVKVNNELERAADAATEVAGATGEIAAIGLPLPQAFEVLSNSVVGILRDVTRSFERQDPTLAKIVLDSEDTVEAFKGRLLRDSEKAIADGSMPVDLAFALHELAAQCVRVADHATNVAEQVIYSVTGAIVRHTDAGWIELPRR